jgi:hypothetical protein
MSNALRADKLDELREPEYVVSNDDDQYSGPVYRLTARLNVGQNNISKAVLGSLLVTLGLTAGAYALVPAGILDLLPVPHIALSFFVTFAALLHLTRFCLAELLAAMAKGFSFVLIIGAISFTSALLTDKTSAGPAEEPDMSYTSVG